VRFKSQNCQKSSFDTLRWRNNGRLLLLTWSVIVQYSLRSAGLGGKLLQNFLHKNPGVKFGIIVEKQQESAFPGWADATYVRQIDDEFAAIELLPRLCVLANKFSNPGFNEHAFDHQPALTRALNDRDLQHAHLSLGARECNTHSKVCICNCLNSQQRIGISRG
jgi:hypothetical protein